MKCFENAINDDKGKQNYGKFIIIILVTKRILTLKAEVEQSPKKNCRSRKHWCVQEKPETTP